MMDRNGLKVVHVDRVRAALRMIAPDHITPLGARMIEAVLDAEDDPEGLMNDE